ncbi:unnamed protein product [Cochlearia groenlandica]
MDGIEKLRDCVIKLRENPKRRKEKVYVGCGAGFAGDRPLAALKLLHRAEEINYIVLECLAERTLADRWLSFSSGGVGYDSRVSEWMHLLLPMAVNKGTCIITNMGAIDPSGAQQKVLEVASELGLTISVAIAHEIDFIQESPSDMRGCPELLLSLLKGTSTYLGAAPIVECLEKYQPDVIITSRVADAALFLAPMIYELGWNWNDLELLSQGTLAGHLLECGCQLTGGYFMHPGDQYRDMAFPLLRDLSLPYAEVGYDGKVYVSKVEGSGGVLNACTCAEQLLYEIGDPSAYITPDVVIDIRDVTFLPLSDCKVQCSGAKPSANTSVPDKLLRLIPKECGWKGWGEISYGGHGCIQRAKASELLVRSWMEETIPGVNECILSYVIGLDSLKATSNDAESCWQSCGDIRLRMDGLFKLKEHAVQLTNEFTALYTNGPAGGGGISTGYKMEIVLEKHLVNRESVMWKIGLEQTNTSESDTLEKHSTVANEKIPKVSNSYGGIQHSPAPYGEKITLYSVAHSRAGDKGNDINFSVIPYYAADIERLKLIITPQWVKKVMATNEKGVSVEIYEVKGIKALNVVVRNILDGGVNCSRRIDRHGKTISDLILCQQVVL